MKRSRLLILQEKTEKEGVANMKQSRKREIDVQSKIERELSNTDILQYQLQSISCLPLRVMLSVNSLTQFLVPNLFFIYHLSHTVHSLSFFLHLPILLLLTLVFVFLSLVTLSFSLYFSGCFSIHLLYSPLPVFSFLTIFSP